MATDGDTHLLHCAICFENKGNKTPKGLVCQHSFCLQCLTEWHETRVRQGTEVQDIVECPVCRAGTPLPEKGVAGLPTDFKVSEAETIMSSIGSQFLCQKCTKSGLSRPVKALCKDCNRRLCEDCTTMHQKIEFFSSHDIVQELCRQHAEEAKYLCLSCYEKLCVDCVMDATHKGHEVCKIADGEDRVSMKLEEKKSQLEKTLRNLDAQTNTEIDDSKKAKDLRKKHLWDTWDNVKKQMDDIVLGMIGKHEEEHEKQVDEIYGKYKNMFNKGNQVLSNIEKVCRSALLENLTEAKHADTDAIETLAAITQPPRISVISCQTCPFEGLLEIPKTLQNCFISCNVSAALMKTLNPSPSAKLKFQIQCREDDEDIERPVSVHSLSDGTAVIYDARKDELIKINTSGDIIGKVSAPRCERICIQDDFLWMTGEYFDDITKYKWEMELEEELEVDFDIASSASDFFLLGEDVVLLADEGIERRALADPGKKGKQVPLQHDVRSLVCADYGQESIYVGLTEKKQVVVYDQNVFQNMIGNVKQNPGNLKIPKSPVIMGNWHLLVADFKLNKVSRYTLDGTFLNDTLTGEDGLVRPSRIAYCHPYLWVLEKHEVYYDSDSDGESEDNSEVDSCEEKVEMKSNSDQDSSDDGTDPDGPVLACIKLFILD